MATTCPVDEQRDLIFSFIYIDNDLLYQNPHYSLLNARIRVRGIPDCGEILCKQQPFINPNSLCHG